MNRNTIFGTMDMIIYSTRTFFILLFACYIFVKVLNINKVKNKIMYLIFLICISLISFIIGESFGYYISIIFQLAVFVLLNKISYKKTIGNTIINAIVSYSISYVVLYVAIFLSSIPTYLFNIQNDYLILIMMILTYFVLICMFVRVKKIKNGLIFLQNKIDNENLDILLLNISSMILIITMLFSTGKMIINILVTLFAIILIMIIIIKQSLDSYYKHNLLVKDLQETKEALESKTKEVEELQKDILSFNKTSHTLAHKQRALEYKINELIYKYEISEEFDLQDELTTLSKEVYTRQAETELTKTEIPGIDNMLKFMQSEAILKNIEFTLQINGSIHYMTNHFIDKKDLETLIADHVKDAIIAIEYSENINRSILVKLGKIDDSYGLYIYDSGIEFEKEVLDNLGKKPITTNSDNGGTGMGFMNTFDTLKKYNASLIIQELGEPKKDNYTKILKIKFDNKNEFKVESYKDKITV